MSKDVIIIPTLVIEHHAGKSKKEFKKFGGPARRTVFEWVSAFSYLPGGRDGTFITFISNHPSGDPELDDLFKYEMKPGDKVSIELAILEDLPQTSVTRF